VLGDKLFPLHCRIAHAKGGCRIGARDNRCRVGPGVVADNNPVFSLRDDACQVAILFAFRVVVCFDQCADTAKLVFEFVDTFWSDDAFEAGNLVA
jgi:hypothetical protein